MGIGVERQVRMGLHCLGVERHGSDGQQRKGVAWRAVARQDRTGRESSAREWMGSRGKAWMAWGGWERIGSIGKAWRSSEGTGTQGNGGAGME